MTSECPKCSRTIPDDSVYCSYCGRGLQPSARSTQVSVGGALMIVAATGSLLFFVLSLQALANIYDWYPLLVAQRWFIYDQVHAVLSFSGLLFGFSGAILSLTRKSYNWTMASTALCTLSGGATWILSMIIPHSDALQSFLYYFLPLFVTAFVGTVLISFRKAEFNNKPKRASQATEEE
ncbi:MAG: zinc ribbon domain-containing protein [Candidatus Bathyarchaeota archaeon]|nr:zinc ribbon domain-containing protein [Candidatus Bathyarchaeota archaeon]